MPTRRLTETFTRFIESERAGGLLLALATVASLALANSPLGASWLGFWHADVAGMSIEHWVNDGLMAIFFLMIGLELERALYVGELSSLRHALLPIFAAIGGMAVPALIHYALNEGLPTQPGLGIPMATDIAFALGALSLLGARVPTPLKVFVVAFAVIDDLGAIVMIALFYTKQLSLPYLAGSLAVWVLLLVMNRSRRVHALTPYLIGGALMWVLMLKSGVHATLAGVLLAFAIPFHARDEHTPSPSHVLENWLHKPVAFIVLPVFALANTGVVLEASLWEQVMAPNGLGIMAGLIVGKPIGIVLLSALAVTLRICRLPERVNWTHLVGAGLLGGIGFTMSIFITGLAFGEQPLLVDSSKLAIFLASVLAGVLGSLVLMSVKKAED
jgi:NhaA family Na+:H+ antiporter